MAFLPTVALLIAALLPSAAPHAFQDEASALESVRRRQNE